MVRCPRAVGWLWWMMRRWSMLPWVGQAVLFARRTRLAARGREQCWVDPDAAVGAELGAAQHISTWMALAPAHHGAVLAERLPTVAVLFAAGLIGEAPVRASGASTPNTQTQRRLRRRAQ
jgi:hypothetical protein